MRKRFIYYMYLHNNIQRNYYVNFKYKIIKDTQTYKSKSLGNY